MNLNKEVLTKIYHRLGDDLSKEIFANRVMYTITGDGHASVNVADLIERW